jgi:hypothetical protein
MSGNNIASEDLKRIVASATSNFFNPMHPYHMLRIIYAKIYLETPK